MHVPRMRRVLGMVALFAFAFGATGSAQSSNITDEDLDIAIKQAVAWLWSQQKSDGSWDEGEFGAQFTGGVSALVTYALLEAGESPHDERMLKSLKHLEEVEEVHSTYARAFRTLVWASLDDQKYERHVNADSRWLIKSQSNAGGWGYPGTWGAQTTGAAATDYMDNSNSQIAMLALWEASHFPGNEVPRSIFRRAEDYWTRSQNADGGWGYQPSWLPNPMESRSYGPMTAAGLATLNIIYDRVHVGDESGKIRPRPGSAARGRKNVDELLERIDAASAWLAGKFDLDRVSGTSNHWANQWLGYYYYSIDRAGTASGRKYIGDVEWYPRVVAKVLSQQRPDGSWNDLINTSFTLLSLLKGRAPIIINKLQYAEEGWNDYPRDAAKLTRWMSRLFEQPFGWQIVEVHNAARDLMDAPIVLITGEADLQLDDALKKALIDYVWAGGTIVASPTEDDGKFAERCEAVFSEMFPELTADVLAAEHPVFSMQYRVGTPTEIIGLSDGCRTRVFVFKEDVSLIWHQGRWETERPLFELGANLYRYATGQSSEPRTRLRPMFAAPSHAPREVWPIARGKHEGDWAAVPRVIEHLSRALAATCGVGLREEIVDLASVDADRMPLVWLTGHDRIALTAEQAEGLKRYLRAGGTVLVDAASSAASFDASFRELVADQFGEKALEPMDPDHPLLSGALAGPLGSDVRACRFNREALEANADLSSPVLYTVRFGSGLGIIYSPYGLACPADGMACIGRPSYDVASARAILGNVIMSVMRRLPPVK